MLYSKGGTQAAILVLAASTLCGSRGKKDTKIQLCGCLCTLYIVLAVMLQKYKQRAVFIILMMPTVSIEINSSFYHAHLQNVLGLISLLFHNTSCDNVLKLVQTIADFLLKSMMQIFRRMHVQ